MQLFKVPLLHSDMFVRSLDFTTKTIEYSIHTHDGGLLEPRRKSVFVISENKIDFDGRFINLDYAKHVSATLL